MWCSQRIPDLYNFDHIKAWLWFIFYRCSCRLMYRKTWFILTKLAFVVVRFSTKWLQILHTPEGLSLYFVSWFLPEWIWPEGGSFGCSRRATFLDCEGVRTIPAFFAEDPIKGGLPLLVEPLRPWEPSTFGPLFVARSLWVSLDPFRIWSSKVSASSSLALDSNNCVHKSSRH